MHLEACRVVMIVTSYHRRMGGEDRGAAATQKNLKLEKLGKFLLNSTKIRAIFAESVRSRAIRTRYPDNFC